MRGGGLDRLWLEWNKGLCFRGFLNILQYKFINMEEEFLKQRLLKGISYKHRLFVFVRVAFQVNVLNFPFDARTAFKL